MTASTPRPDVRAALLEAAQAELIEHGGAGISLRAVARRAGVSHAAPKHHFGNRVGLLSAVAAEGFALLAAELSRVLAGDVDTDPGRRLALLGRAYVDFGLRHPALFELMFQPGELRTDDPTLTEARRAALGLLSSAVRAVAPSPEAASGTPELALVAWALAHGLVVLSRDGALQAAAGVDRADTKLPRDLVGLFSQRLHD